MLNSFKKRIIFYFSFLITALQSTDTWQYINPCDVLLVRHDNDCGYRYDGKAYAQVIDSFGELCINHNLIVSSVATPHSRFIGERAQFSPVSFDRSSMRISIIGKIIEMINGYEISKEWTQSHHTHLWCQILKKAKPKCIIGIQPDEFLCRAGKLQKIPVYDLQHGVIADEHLWYGEVYRMGTPIEKLPDGFLCWDDQSVATLSKWASNKGIRVLKIGNPWFLRFAYVQPEDLLVSEALANCNVIDDNRPCILVSLQWAMATFYPDKEFNGVMIDALEKVILDTSELYNWVIRLHPVQMSGDERDMVLNFLQTTFGTEMTRRSIMASEIPLPILIRKTDLHITHHSTVVVEAAWGGVRSGLLSEQFGPGGEYQTMFSYERSLGIAELIPQNPECIKQWITDTLAKGRGQSTLKDYSQNLDAFIDEIAGRKA